MSGVLAALAQELGTDPESLRDALFAGDESLQPTYLTVNAAGQVTAVFTGHVQAGGVDLIADDAATLLKPDRKIQWHRGSYDGPVVSEIDTYDVVGQITSQLHRTITDQPIAGNQILARSGASATSAALSVISDDNPANTRAFVSMGGFNYNLLTSALLSEWHFRRVKSSMGLVPAWANVGAPWATAQICGTSMQAGGFVHLGGAIAGNGGGTFIDNSNNYQYPGPSGQMDFICSSSLGAVAVRVAANGDITYPAGGVIARLNLDNVSWVIP